MSTVGSPPGKKYEAITFEKGSSRINYVSPGLVLPILDTFSTVSITLMEYDSGSGDDLLGCLDVTVSDDSAVKEVMVANPDEGSIYTIMYQVRART